MGNEVKVTRLGFDDRGKVELQWVLELGNAGYKYCIGGEDDYDGYSFFFSTHDLKVTREDLNDIIQAYLNLEPRAGQTTQIKLSEGYVVTVEVH